MVIIYTYDEMFCMSLKRNTHIIAPKNVYKIIISQMLFGEQDNLGYK